MYILISNQTGEKLIYELPQKEIQWLKTIYMVKNIKQQNMPKS